MANANEPRILSPPTESIRVLGLIGQLDKKYKHLLNIFVRASDCQNPVMQLDKDCMGEKREVQFRNVLNLEQESNLTIQIFKNRSKARFITERALLTRTITYDNIWQHLKSVSSADQCFEVHTNPETEGVHIWINAEVSSSNAADPLRASSSNIDDPLTNTEKKLNDAIASLERYKTALDRLGWAQDPIKTGIEFGKAISKINPIASTVLACVDQVYKQLEDQDNIHKQIIALAKSMDRMVDYMKAIEEIPKFDKLEETLKQFPDLMKDMADFIEKWLRSGPVNRLRGIVNKGELDDLKSRLDGFEKDFDRGIAVDMRKFVTESEDGKELKEALLKGINPYEENRAEPCMENTRQDILSDVDTRINDLDGENVIWITGYPGVGKSALASSIKSRQHEHGRFVLYFRFDRANSAVTTPSALWRGTAYHLARRYPSVRKCILDLLNDPDGFDVGSPSVGHLFTSLVKTPLSKSSTSDTPRDRPLVIVIDGVDECGGFLGSRSKDHRDLLNTLDGWRELPSNFKLVVTSRPDDAIAHVTSSIKSHIIIPSGDDVSDASQQDILTFLNDHLRRIQASFNLEDTWHDQAVTELGSSAAGVFQWAATAVRFLERGDPVIRLRVIQRDRLGSLDSLYTTVIEVGFDNPQFEELLSFRAVVGAMLFTKVSPQGTSKECADFLAITESALLAVRKGLYSVMDEGDTLRFSHQSFADFLLSESCPLKYSMKDAEPEQHRRLSELCLGAMTTKLRFNMCGLETSSLKNTEVPNIDIKVKEGIPSLLAYSCCFWADHLKLSPVDERPIETVKGMVYDRLLFWVEAMSLLKEMNRAIPVLRMVLECLDSTRDGAIIAFIRDTLRFIAAFIIPITQSAPHIYLSALPFAPEESLVARHFLLKFPNTIKFIQGRLAHWPSSVFVSECSNTPISHIAFSPDQKTFMSIFLYCGHICICDSETGSPIAGPVNLRGNGSLRSICFSPDGGYIVIGYRTLNEERESLLVMLDARTGEEIRRFEGPKQIYSVAYYNGGPLIVTLSDKSPSSYLVKLWDPETSKLVRDLLEIPSNSDSWPVMSPDGCMVISKHQDDGSLRVWQVTDEPTLPCMILQQDGGFRYFAFSLDYRRLVVTQSYDGTVRVWNSKTGGRVGHPLEFQSADKLIVFSFDHDLLVVSDSNSVAAWKFRMPSVTFEETAQDFKYECFSLSRDGRRLLVGCSDGRVRLWDLTRNAPPATEPTGKNLGQSMESLLFSPSGETVVACWWDGISFWDAATGEATSPGRIATKNKTASYSPDGRYIFSAEYKKIYIWDTETGQAADEPLVMDDTVLDLIFQASYDDHLVVSFSEKIWVYDFKRRQVISSITFSDINIQDSSHPAYNISPDGLTIIAGHPDINYYRWDTSTNKFSPYTTLTNTNHFSYDSAFYSPNGKLLASCSGKVLPTRKRQVKNLISFQFNHRSDGLIRTWQVETGSYLTTFPLSRDDGINDVLAFLPNEQYVVSAGRTLVIRDTLTSYCIGGPWRNSLYRIRKIAFSQDGKRMASYASKGTIMVWDISDFQAGQPQVSDGGSEYEPDVVEILVGWAIGKDEKRLFWVPVEHRLGLLGPRHIAVIGAAPTRLDLTKFKYGEKWEECIDQKWRRRVEHGHEIAK